LFIDYLEKGKTITGEYYSNLLTGLDEKIREKRPGLQKKKIIFYQDNTPAQKSVLAMRKFKGSAPLIVGTSTLFPRFGSL
jgi:hypothetical protein